MQRKQAGDEKGHQNTCNPVGECMSRLSMSDCQLGESLFSDNNCFRSKSRGTEGQKKL